MIVGEYNEDKAQATIEISLGDGVREAQIVAVVDTGFTNYLMLPAKAVQTLQLIVVRQEQVSFADGGFGLLNVCQIQIDWHGKRRSVPAYVAEGGEPLIGMRLLRGNIVTLELTDDGGSVTIERA